MKTRNTILATASLLPVANCATITRGSKDVLEIRTDPAGAAVQTSNGFSCGSAPYATKMPLRSEFVGDITKPGCKPMQVNVTHKTAGDGAAGVSENVLVGGVIGLAVDAGTDAS
jgi:hypothetical protein